MRKPVLIGAGLGLLVLGLVAAQFWIPGNSLPPGAPVVTKVEPHERTVPIEGKGVVTPAGIDGAISQSLSSQESQKRRKRLSEVRAQFNALRSQGAEASPEKMAALVDEMQALSPPGFDPRYFQTLRNIINSNGRLQVLNKELYGIANSTGAKDEARRQKIITEMRALGEEISAEVRYLQSYAPTLPSGAK